ncbi:TPA: hypothetical protein ACGQVP_003102 [Raoultella planticola]
MVARIRRWYGNPGGFLMGGDIPRWRCADRGYGGMAARIRRWRGNPGGFLMGGDIPPVALR